ncbi:MAG: MATE family efflux transporter [Treponema sp.]|nr:MATE family efflux transporter [Treponema sp.]
MNATPADTKTDSNSSSPAQPVLTAKEARRREQILHGPELPVIFSIALPLVFYNSLHQVFQLIDTLIAANMSAGVVSTVSFVEQIQAMLAAIGSGLSVGGSVIISRSYGSGDMEKVRSQISTLFFACLAVGTLLLSLCIPLAYPILRLLRMPEDLLAQGTAYFMLSVTGIVFLFINTIYLAIEKSRGNTKVMMWCNMLVMVLKTVLNAGIVLLLQRKSVSLNTAMLLLPVATILAQGALTAIAIVTLVSRKNPFRLSLKACTFNRSFLRPLSALSIPVFLEKFIFAFGKVIVNSMCATMGSTVVGALGVSNRLGGFCTNPPSGFQDAESSLISQNIGAANLKRALGIFYRTLFINLGIATGLLVLMLAFKNSIIMLFARGDAAFAGEINAIYTYECWDSVLISINASVMGLLYGFGKTRITMVLNVIRLFVYRIPPLFLLLHFTNIGVPAVGIAMLISNGAVGITSGIVAVWFIRKVKSGTMQYSL